MFRPVVAIIRFYHSTRLRLFYTIRVEGVCDEEISTSKPLLEHTQYRGTMLQQGF